MTSVFDFNPCTYAFLAESDTFHFDALGDLRNLRNVSQFPLVLDWSIGNQTCEQVGNKSICSMSNSLCFNSTRGTGYNCKCLEGFEGNPYLSNEHGCRGTPQIGFVFYFVEFIVSLIHLLCFISLCQTSMSVLVLSINITVRNKDGGFYCKCKSGYRLDTTNMSCKRKDFGWATILLGKLPSGLIAPLTYCLQDLSIYV